MRLIRDFFTGSLLTGILVPAIQKELIRLGYYRGQIDGIAGSETGQALRWFQSVDKLPVTGQIDSATVKALRIG